jgi:hypothetical protein
VEIQLVQESLEQQALEAVLELLEEMVIVLVMAV